MNPLVQKIASNVANSVVAIKFKSQEEYLKYKKEHDMKKDTKVEIEKGKAPTAPKAPVQNAPLTPEVDYTKSEKYIKHQELLDKLHDKAPNRYKKKMEDAMKIVERYQKQGLSLQEAVKKYHQDHV